MDHGANPGAETAKAPRAGSEAVLPEMMLLLALLVGGLLGLRLVAGPPAGQGREEPVESISIDRVILRPPAEIVVEASNNGADVVTVAQVMVDDNYWAFSVSPSPVIRRLGRATIHIPYLWTRNEPSVVTLVSSNGEIFEGAVGEVRPGGLMSPTAIGRYALLGIYVGPVPIGLGILWHPFLYPLGRRRLLAALGLGAGLSLVILFMLAAEAAPLMAGALGEGGAALLVLSVALLGFAALMAAGSRPALGAGLRSLGKGLAIGAAFALGQTAFALFLMVGFALHSVAEGARLGAPPAQGRPAWWRAALLAALAGLPTALGVAAGDLAPSALAASICLALGAGAAAQVAYQAGRLALRRGEGEGAPLLLLAAAGGVAAGLAISYAAALLAAP